MKHYQEISLANPELWQHLFNQIHIGLADIKNKHGITSAGISFPDYSLDPATLGKRLRIFGTQDELQKLDIAKWVQNKAITISDIMPTPKHHKHLLVTRYRYKSLEQQAMNYAVLKRISFDEAKKHVEQYRRKPIDYPFVIAHSKTNSNTYHFHIKQVQVDTPKTGNFSTFGLSNEVDCVTVPDF